MSDEDQELLRRALENQAKLLEENERLRAERDECRMLLRIAFDSIDHAVVKGDNGQFFLSRVPDFINREWQTKSIVAITPPVRQEVQNE